MLPASTGDRKQRDVTKGRPDGRTVEIQRLIGRSMRGVVDFAALGERTDLPRLRRADRRRRHALRVDHRRATSRSTLACRRLVGEGTLAALAADRQRSPRSPAGSSTASPLLDLDYSEDSTAEVDANVVMTGDGGLVEVQATAERTPLSRAHLDDLLALAGRRDRAAARAAGRRSRPVRVRLVLATRNAHKAREFAALLAPHEVVALPDDVVLPPETGETFADNALDKARAAARATGAARRSPTTPGSRPPRSAARPACCSARFAGEDATDEENLAKLLRRGAGRQRAGLRLRAGLVDPDGGEQSSRAAAPARWPPSRAATAASATTRRSCPTTSRRRAHDGRARPRPRRRRSATAAVRRARCSPWLDTPGTDMAGPLIVSAGRARHGQDRVRRRCRSPPTRVLIVLKVVAGRGHGLGGDPHRGDALLDRPRRVDRRVLLRPQGGRARRRRPSLRPREDREPRRGHRGDAHPRRLRR